MSDRLGSLFFAAIAQANTPRVERTERLDGSQTSPRRLKLPMGRSLVPLQAGGLTISPSSLGGRSLLRASKIS